MKVQYSWILGTMVSKESCQEYSDLFSNHYGVWSKNSPISPGKKVKLSPARVWDWVHMGKMDIYEARLDDMLIGYAIATKSNVPKYGVVSWVIQLVVHEDYRKKDIAKTLLFSIWGFSNHFSWGIITPNPFAIRALEKATRRRCVPERISRNKRKLIELGRDRVPYIKEDTPSEINKIVSKINTDFFVDRSEVPEMIELASTEEIPWLLGTLEEGWEWFAFTFKDQEQINLTSLEVQKMIDASDQVTRQAYSRMELKKDHVWAQFSEQEAKFIIKYCNLEKGHSVLDFGCGTGRHSIALANMGIKVTGVEYIENFVNLAKEKTAHMEINRPQFYVADCRDVKLEQEFDALICLYDVVGTYADNGENLRILRNITEHLKPCGRALISVMNYELTAHKAKHTFSLKEQPNKLLELPASEIMGKTGEIFNPNHFMIDTDTCVVYRKEQFTAGKSLPVELIVRDRRFRKEEIETMCESVGLEVLWSRFVSADNWDNTLDCRHNSAKEILLLCRKKVAFLPYKGINTDTI